MHGDAPAFLSTLPYFQGLSPTELARVHGRCRTRALVAGEIVVHEGQPADALYAVQRGRVRQYTISPEGKEQVLFVAGPGTTFNDTAVFDHGPALATAEALTADTCICVVPAALMRHLLAANPRVAANVVRVLPSRVRQLTALVEELSFHHIVQRVARLLLEENEATGQVGLTKHEMAARVGTVREAVSRTLHELEQRGAITRQHNRIVHVNTAALLAVLGAASPASEPAPRQQAVAGTHLEHQESSLAGCS
jgi:CRP/FNR family cyclic AMP-dependent transcriptional regulator